MCPTRWNYTSDSLASILLNYKVLMELWDAIIEIVHDSKTVARINGVASAMKTFSFLIGIKHDEMTNFEVDEAALPTTKKGMLT